MPGDLVSPLTEDERHSRERRRLLEMCGLACGIGVLGAGAALVLQAVIVLTTNLFFFGRLSLTVVSPVDHHLGLLELTRLLTVNPARILRLPVGRLAVGVTPAEQIPSRLGQPLQAGVQRREQFSGRRDRLGLALRVVDQELGQAAVQEA